MALVALQRTQPGGPDVDVPRPVVRVTRGPTCSSPTGPPAQHRRPARPRATPWPTSARTRS
jgi:hypothetical protein